MKLDLSCTNTNSQPRLGELDFGGQMRPSHPVLVVDRAECDGDSFTIPPEILHIKVMDGDRMAHFHIRVGVKKGRPFVDVCAIAPHTDKIKKITGAWLPVLREKE